MIDKQTELREVVADLRANLYPNGALTAHAATLLEEIEEWKDELAHELGDVKAELEATQKHLDAVYKVTGHSTYSSEPVSEAVLRLKSELEKAQAACAVKQERLSQLLEVAVFIDNEDKHQTKVIKEAMADNCGQPLLDRTARLEKALADLFSLVESGVLVRDTSEDSEPGWAMRQLPFIKALTQAREALAKQI